MTNHLFDLTGKVAVVTGASVKGGVGHALALGFAQYGADVIAADIDAEGAKVTSEEVRALGRKSTAVYCDISDPTDVEGLFTQVDEGYGRVDILANVPYTLPSRVHPHELSLEAWDKTLAVSLKGYFLCAQQAIRRMLKQGGGD